MNARFVPGPYLWRDVEDHFRVPAGNGCRDLFDRFREAQVEARVIDQNDCIRSSFGGKHEKAIEKGFKLGIVFQHLNDAHDRVFREIKSELNLLCCHPGSSSSIKLSIREL